jgi:MYXO-CTERM domain-containing protein
LITSAAIAPMLIALLLWSDLAFAHTITVDGDPSEWDVAGWEMDAPSQDNLGHIGRDLVDQGQYIWTDAARDERTVFTDPSPDPRVDLIEFRITSDLTDLYFLARFTDIPAGPGRHYGDGAPLVQIAVDADRAPASGASWFRGYADTEVSRAAYWEDLLSTGFGSPDSITATRAVARVWRTQGSLYEPLGVAIIDADLDVIEGSVPLAALVKPSVMTAQRFTVAVFRGNASNDTWDWGGTGVSNALDALTNYGDPRKTPDDRNTWLEVGDPSLTVDYHFDLWFEPDGDVMPPVVISELLYDAGTSDPFGEFVELGNVSGQPYPLHGVKIGDAELIDEMEGMERLPCGMLVADATVVWANDAIVFNSLYGDWPDFAATGGAVPTTLDPRWATGSVSLLDDTLTGDEVLLIDDFDTVLDVASFGYAAPYPVEAWEGVDGADIAAHAGASLAREPAATSLDRNDMLADFVEDTPGPTPSLCGNAVVDCAEQCDDGVGNGTTQCGCQSGCTLPAAGVLCGSPADTECDNPDTCDGSGTCLTNHEPDGGACGDPLDTECDNPDTCGGGSCLLNHEPIGAPCTDDGLFCTGTEACGGGDCLSSGSPCSAWQYCEEPADECRLSLVINEIDYDMPGTDTAEFVELKNVGPTALALGGFEVRGISDSGPSVYGTWALPDAWLPAGGYFVVCGNSATVANCDLDVSPASNLIQNGDPDAVALFHQTTLVDTVSYEGDTGAPYTEVSGVGLIDNGAVAYQGISRYPDGLDTDVNDVDFSPRCVSPGAENREASVNCLCGNGVTDPGEPCGDFGVACHVDDACDGAGVCHDNGVAIMGAPCGSAEDTYCTDPDACDDAGSCLSYHAAAGTPCGDLGVECLIYDTCDGNGVCNDNGFEVNGTPCGDAGDSECDNPDACGDGACLPRLEPSGAPCGDQGVACHVDDTCDGAGTCSDNGLATEGAPCGNTTATECDAADTCDAAGVCHTNLAVSGAACGDQGIACHVDDTCDGAGACTDNGTLANGTACGDASDTECDNADTCLDGACAPTPEALGAACGDASESECDAADTCDGVGACQPNHDASGAPCGDQGSECLVDDTCDGLGVCVDNGLAPDGTACTAGSCAAGVCEDDGGPAGPQPEGCDCRASGGGSSSAWLTLALGFVARRRRRHDG